jgi:metal transporter CNNM
MHIVADDTPVTASREGKRTVQELSPLLVWIGILLCLSQSAMLSGLNLGLFSLGKLELQVEARKGSPQAQRVLRFREDASFALVTILWGNVGVNVLLALLSDSVLGAVAAFLFSTVVITIFAEIAPQAYFTRHALWAAALLSPVLRVYQAVLYPIARPTAWVLDAWLGGEGIRYYPERDLRRLIQLHMEAAESDIARVEGQGALNFLEIDDVPLGEEGEPIDPDSVLRLEFDGERPVFPPITPTADDPFLRAVNRSGKSWVVIVDRDDRPRLVLRAEDLTREALFAPHRLNPLRHCHRPIMVTDAGTRLGELIHRFRIRSGAIGEHIVEDDVILLWNGLSWNGLSGNGRARVVTGTDVLGRLLRGIARPSTPEGAAGGGQPGAR